MNRPTEDAGTRPGFYSIGRIGGAVVAGVAPGQPQAVTQRAAELACSLNVDLIYAYVDVTTFLNEEPDDSIDALPDPYGVEDDPEGVSARIRARLHQILDGTEARWSFVTLSGDPARALDRLAELVSASIIVVGTRESGLGARLEQLLVGSVAGRLMHRQHRPVLVVPLPPL
jgi:nucleotide-binding universal stress UspA family protein